MVSVRAAMSSSVRSALSTSAAFAYGIRPIVSPISRYSIILGKILGESLVALPQALGIIAFGFILRVPLDGERLLGMAGALAVIALFGGAFGVIVLSNLSSQRAANQIFPFVMLPQFFLAGIFNPIQHLPLPLDILSHLAPMRYAVDLLRARSARPSGRRSPAPRSRPR